MDEEMTIDQYFAKMMMEGEWGGHSDSCFLRNL